MPETNYKINPTVNTKFSERLEFPFPIWKSTAPASHNWDKIWDDMEFHEELNFVLEKNSKTNEKIVILIATRWSKKHKFNQSNVLGTYFDPHSVIKDINYVFQGSVGGQKEKNNLINGIKKHFG